jgi:hypothetical protein
MKYAYLLHLLFFAFIVPSINAQENTKKEIYGWIKSSWGGKRKFKNTEIAGVEWFLKYIEKNEKPKNDEMKSMNLVAELTYSNAIQIEIYSLRYWQEIAGKKNLKRIPENDIYCVKIKKRKPHALFPKLKTDETFTYHFGNIRYDFVLDLLTVPLGKAKSESWPVQILYCIDDGKYGDNLLSKAISWRLFDRGLGWPTGKEGRKYTLDIAEELNEICTKYQSRPAQVWGLAGVKKLGKISKDPETQKILEETETLIKKNANKKDASNSDSAVAKPE